MEDKRILELALTALEEKRSSIEAEIDELRAELGGGSRGRQRVRTASARKSQSERMKAYWAKKRAAVKARPVKKAAPPKTGPSAAARKAQSERMKAYWAAKRAAKTQAPKKAKPEKTA